MIPIKLSCQWLSALRWFNITVDFTGSDGALISRDVCHISPSGIHFSRVGDGRLFPEHPEYPGYPRVEVGDVGSHSVPLVSGPIRARSPREFERLYLRWVRSGTGLILHWVTEAGELYERGNVIVLRQDRVLRLSTGSLWEDMGVATGSQNFRGPRLHFTL